MWSCRTTAPASVVTVLVMGTLLVHHCTGQRQLLVEPRGGVELKKYRLAEAVKQGQSVASAHLPEMAAGTRVTECTAHSEHHLDLDGEAVMWGMNHKTASAEECCQRCKEFSPSAGGKPCTMWVWCGDPSGVCWSMDIWNHTTGECWLKYQPEWDGIPDFNGGSNIKINQRGTFPESFRREHRTAPLLVPWTAGVILT